uniref:NADH-ubiquinone oxidoreductase chain 3 n=1 Tax=Allacma fusca TaxID=39272 RepID=A0A7D5BYS5_9HEXA|nr:NADH dehydrogenase subunit 3 [Allacma fusca]
MMLIMMLTLVVSSFLMIVNSLISIKKMFSREKSSAFECGYDPKSSSRLPFSMQFFLIAMIFLIFDVEITLILPLPLIMKFISTKIWLFISEFFMIILIMGVLHEWKEGSLDWAK